MHESRYFKIIYAPLQDANAQVRGVAVVVIATTRCVDAERDKIALQEKARAAPAQHALQLPLTDQRRSVATRHRSFLLDIGLLGIDGYNLARLLCPLPGTATATLPSATG